MKLQYFMEFGAWLYPILLKIGETMQMQIQGQVTWLFDESA
jgi:hypothetical protein